jgi:hypothetical protein
VVPVNLTVNPVTALDEVFTSVQDTSSDPNPVETKLGAVGAELLTAVAFPPAASLLPATVPHASVEFAASVAAAEFPARFCAITLARDEAFKAIAEVPTSIVQLVLELVRTFKQ